MPPTHTKKGRPIIAALLYTCLLSVTVITFSCNIFTTQKISGSGITARVSKPVSHFSDIEISGAFEVILTPGSPESLTIEGDDNLLQYVVTAQKGNTLRIQIKNGVNINPQKALKVYLSAPEIAGLDISGANNISSTGPIVCNQSFDLDVSGANDINLNVSSPDIEVSGSGASDIKLTGTFRQAAFDISGASSLNLNIHTQTIRIKGTGSTHVAIDGSAGTGTLSLSGNSGFSGFNFPLSSLYADLSGASTASVNTAQDLTMDLSGASEVKYKGSPKIKLNASGGAAAEKVE